jgi:hypothetical protein
MSAATAEEAVRLAGVDPRRATQLATTALAEAGRHDRDAAAQACRALGLAARERRDLPGARDWFRRSLRHARAAGSPQREAEALLSLALVEAMGGRFRAALASLDAADALDGAPRAPIAAQRALVLTQAGRFDEALAAYRGAIDLVRRSGAAADEAKLLNNRAILWCWRGDTVAAEADIRRAAALAAETGNDYAAVSAAQTLGWILGRRGDVPAALRALDDAEPEFERIGFGLEELHRDRAELLLSARLVDEAVAAARAALAAVEASGAKAEAGEARLLLSHALLLQGDAEHALDAARRARRSFRADGRPAWAALATYAELRALVASAPPSAALCRRAMAVADELAGAGWDVPSLDARLTAARLAFARGDVELGTAACARASTARRAGPAELRTRAWHAEALRRLATGDRRGADAALRRGLQIVDDLREAMGATELRAHVAAHGEALAELGLDLALAAGGARRVLGWAERTRAQAMRPRPARPPADADLGRALAELRGVIADVEEALLDGDDDPRLRARQVELERDVSRLTRRASPSAGPRHLAVSGAALADALGDAVLVELVPAGTQLAAVVVSGRRAALHHLGPSDPIRSAVERLAFGLRRLARPGVTATTARTAHDAVDHAAAEVDGLLLAPLLRGVAEEQPVVLVPTAELHAAAWSAMPSLRDRGFTVAPSATVWLAARARRALGATRVVAVAGPGLEAADAEVRSIAAMHSDVTSFDSASSGVDAVLDALDGAALAHVAAHGRFRADNPLFSSLVLADGPLFVHDLERIARAPATVVLSACDVGRAGHPAGEELLGMLTGLLTLGTSAVVASVVPVPDVATCTLMTAFHRSLAAGAGVAEALRRARSEVDEGDGPSVAAARSFAAYGDGLETPIPLT